MNNSTPPSIQHLAYVCRDIRAEVRKLIVGQEVLIDRLLVALIANGHVLLEGVPGLAKTKTITALAACLDVKVNRVQFTPDLLPSDLIGTEVYRPQNGEFVIRKGPIFGHVVLADEINRAPPKVQSALLQAMQERCVTIGDVTFKLPRPFLVLATQNPIEQEGTYQLPEAQLDRFLMKVKVTYPSLEDELLILNHAGIDDSTDPPELRVILISEDWTRMAEALRDVQVDPRVDRYIVALVRATREPTAPGLRGMIAWGASPRAAIALRTCATALACVRGHSVLVPDFVKEIAADVLRHRLIPSLEAEARAVDPDQLVVSLLQSVSVP